MATSVAHRSTEGGTAWVSASRRRPPRPSNRLRGSVRELVVLVGARGVSGGAIGARQLVDRVRRRGLELRLGERHHVAVFHLVIVERGPGYRMELLVHAEKPAEADHGEDDVVRLLVEHDVFDLADLLAGRVL